VEILVFILFRILFNKMKHITEIILATLIVGCLIALIVILTNSCKNAGFRLKQSFSTPTPSKKVVLDTLTFFGNCTPLTGDAAEALHKNNISANTVIFAPFESLKTPGCEAVVKSMQSLTSNNDKVRYAPVISDASYVGSDCAPQKTKPNLTVDDIMTCIKNRTPDIAAGVDTLMTSQGDISISDEDEKIYLGKPTDTYFAGTYKSKYSGSPGPSPKVIKVAGGETGTGYPQKLQVCKELKLTNDVLDITSCKTSEPTVDVDVWAPEKSYEPSKDPDHKDTMGGCAKPGSTGPCCDGSTTCADLWYTSCAFNNGSGWANLVQDMTVPKSKFVTLGYQNCKLNCKSTQQACNSDDQCKGQLDSFGKLAPTCVMPSSGSSPGVCRHPYDENSCNPKVCPPGTTAYFDIDSKVCTCEIMANSMCNANGPDVLATSVRAAQKNPDHPRTSVTIYTRE